MGKGRESDGNARPFRSPRPPRTAAPPPPPPLPPCRSAASGNARRYRWVLRGWRSRGGGRGSRAAAWLCSVLGRLQKSFSLRRRRLLTVSRSLAPRAEMPLSESPRSAGGARTVSPAAPRAEKLRTSRSERGAACRSTALLGFGVWKAAKKS